MLDVLDVSPSDFGDEGEDARHKRHDDDQCVHHGFGLLCVIIVIIIIILANVSDHRRPAPRSDRKPFYEAGASLGSRLFFRVINQ